MTPEQERDELRLVLHETRLNLRKMRMGFALATAWGLTGWLLYGIH